MKLRFMAEVDVKNDGLTQDCGYHDIAAIIQDALEDNKLDKLPWVISERYRLMPNEEQASPA